MVLYSKNLNQVSLQDKRRGERQMKLFMIEELLYFVTLAVAYVSALARRT